MDSRIASHPDTFELGSAQNPSCMQCKVWHSLCKDLPIGHICLWKISGEIPSSTLGESRGRASQEIIWFDRRESRPDLQCILYLKVVPVSWTEIWEKHDARRSKLYQVKSRTTSGVFCYSPAKPIALQAASTFSVEGYGCQCSERATHHAKDFRVLGAAFEWKIAMQTTSGSSRGSLS